MVQSCVAGFRFDALPLVIPTHDAGREPARPEAGAAADAAGAQFQFSLPVITSYRLLSDSFGPVP